MPNNTKSDVKKLISQKPMRKELKTAADRHLVAMRRQKKTEGPTDTWTKFHTHLTEKDRK